MDTAKLEEFHSEISDIESKMKHNHLDQQASALDPARRVGEALHKTIFISSHRE